MEGEFVSFTVDGGKLSNYIKDAIGRQFAIKFLTAFTRLVEIDPNFVIGKRMLMTKMLIEPETMLAYMNSGNTITLKANIMDGSEHEHAKQGRILMIFKLHKNKKDILEIGISKGSFRKCNECEKKGVKTCQKCLQYNACKAHLDGFKEHDAECLEMWLCNACDESIVKKCVHCMEIGFCETHLTDPTTNLDHLSQSESCNSCYKKGTVRCERCSKVFYCSKEHQEADWKSHKVVCRLPKCEVCENKSSFYCTCRKVKYCSKEHQKQDWDKHKSVCTKIPPQCEVCKRQALVPCPCEQAFYCCTYHREDNWKARHKFFCPLNRKMCYVCGEPTKYKCPCSKIRYCSEDHQSEDWDRHKISHK